MTPALLHSSDFPDGFDRSGPADPSAWGSFEPYVLPVCVMVSVLGCAVVVWAWRAGASRRGPARARMHLAALCAAMLAVGATAFAADSVLARPGNDDVTNSRWTYGGVVRVEAAHEGTRGRQWLDVRLASGQVERLDLVSRADVGGAPNGATVRITVRCGARKSGFLGLGDGFVTHRCTLLPSHGG